MRSREINKAIPEADKWMEKISWVRGTARAARARWRGFSRQVVRKVMGGGSSAVLGRKGVPGGGI